MGNFQVLALCESSSLSQTFGQKKLNGISFIGIVDNNDDAYMLLEKFSIDAVFMEITSPDSAYEFMEQMPSMQKNPLVVAMSDLQEGDCYIRARRLGAKLVYKAPYNIDKILEDTLTTLRDDNQYSISIKTPDKVLDERLANIFISSGIPPHIKGYQFLREAVKQSIKTPAMVNNITKQLYPAVAEKFGTSPSKVERAIRHAIEVAWSRGKIDNINTIYGIKVFSKSEKPTNGELIALVSDKMIIECS